jgi:phage N-6-adenine-methyltransferase
MLADSEVISLAQDIEKNGQQFPIVLHDGEILDGRNRFRACEHLGIAPEFKEYAGDNPLSYVVSLNLHRRHLSESQRAMVAANIANMGAGRPTNNAQICAVSQPEAAAMVNVSRRSVQNARQVQNEGIPELINAVEQGDVSVSRASDISSYPIEEQKESLSHLSIGTGNDEWYTPSEWVEMARKVMGGIDLDPASNEEANKIIKATKFFTKEDCGLEKDWFGKVWINPPYSRELMPKFATKIIEQRDNCEEIIILSHNNTETNWFQGLAGVSNCICFPSSRISFYNKSKKASPVQGQAFFYIGESSEKFTQVFKERGLVLYA